MMQKLSEESPAHHFMIAGCVLCIWFASAGSLLKNQLWSEIKDLSQLETQQGCKQLTGLLSLTLSHFQLEAESRNLPVAARWTVLGMLPNLEVSAASCQQYFEAGNRHADIHQ